MESLLHINSITFPILSLITFMPIVGAGMLMLIRDDQGIRIFSVIVTLFTFIMSIPLYVHFDPDLAGFQFVENKPWVPRFGLTYLMGVDGISLPLILLTTFFGPITVLCSWRYIATRVREFMICILLTQGIMVGVFASLDMVLFYIFFEALLIPMFLLIAIWGGPRRIYAAIKFVLFTLGGSIFLLLAIIGLYMKAGTFAYPAMLGLNLTITWEFWIFLGFLIAFAVKVPMFPVHTWLPAAHVEAPTAGSVILASILLKMGTYGLLRFNLALTPHASVELSPYVLALSVAAILYGGLLSLAQSDIKKLIAYSSVSHMGFVTLGIFVLNLQGTQGGMLQMINHGLTTGGLFLLAGMLYERTHSRHLDVNAGLGRLMPAFAFFLGLFSLSSLAFPGTASFVGEFLCLSGAFSFSNKLGAWVIPGALLAAAYMFRIFLRVIWGSGGKIELAADLNLREWICLSPLALLVIIFGFHPAPLMKIMNPALENLLARLPREGTLSLATLFNEISFSVFN
ncbi:MAG TPA: NADH-quinone oxidoreductase subunit M [Thermodesulfobacteriaceae bacterium]|nr:NADH-quinone oxidoreductase subunit M [Thermodesulfobacteriaceae bacterium]